ncbi:MAG TPA: hypothetical protein VE504_07675 [Nitrososphaeraceae archaeon]|nr:hypothetical protein [Nitrososphaeraceae archaeon]
MDLSFLPIELRSSIIRNISKALSSQNSVIGIKETNSMASDRNENGVVSATDDNDPLYIVQWVNGSLKDFKLFVENILRIDYVGYMVAEDIETVDTLTILKQGDVEQFGVHMCSHCGTFFKSIEERTVHERIHYFI